VTRRSMQEVYGHLRMSELEAIAQATGAELVALPRGEHSGHKRLEALQDEASSGG
jgi:hypothetical protein